MTRSAFGASPCLAALAFAAAFLAGCGDDDFTPVSKNRGYDYAFTSSKEFANYPCNEMREGREAIVGRDKDSYFCEFDEIDSVYIWAGYNDTLTAMGKEFVRKDASSSSCESSSSEDDDGSSSSRYSSSYSSSSYRSSSSYSSSYSSSSSSARSSSSSLNWEELKPRLTEKDEQLNPDIEYGTMTDPRDGKTYKTVDVEGTIWMAENLNYTDHEVGKSYCFKGDEEICKLYGRFYSRDAAMNSSKCEYGASCLLGNDPIQGVCPDGWHIPTYSETQALVTLAGKKAQPLMSTIGWGTEDSLYINPGVDTYGLSFVGTGQYDTKDGYNDIGEYAFMWVYYQSSDMYYLLIRGKDNEAFINDFDGYEANFSVRCVKGKGVPASSSSLSSSSAKSSSSSYSSSSAKSSSSSESSSSVSSSSAKSSSSVSSSSVSSSSIASSSSSNPKDKLFNPNISYGIMTDPRDGRSYRTLYIAGHTWMAENLNFADSAETHRAMLGERDRCYNNDENECEMFGRLYMREAALDTTFCTTGIVCNLGTGPIQGICPDGWHIPSYDEADDLVKFIGTGNGNNAKSTYGWDEDYKGNNANGMSFVGAGYRWAYNVSYTGKGELTYLWVYREAQESYRIAVEGNGTIKIVNDKEYGDHYSVRCVKD